MKSRLNCPELGRKPRYRGDLPNQAGFEFTAILANGSRIPCEVRLSPVHGHYVHGCEYRQIQDWEPLKS